MPSRRPLTLPAKLRRELAAKAASEVEDENEISGLLEDVIAALDCQDVPGPASRLPFNALARSRS
jgi:hypothetical protein